MPTTWNPADKSASVTLSGSNLTATGSASAGGVRANAFKTTGKVYWEYTCTAASGTATGSGTDIGIGLSSAILSSVGGSGTNAVLQIMSSGIIYVNGNTSAFGGAVVCPATVAVAVDFTGKKFWLRALNGGQWNGNNATNDPGTGLGGSDISSLSGNWYPLVTFSAADVITANFGASAFVGSMPTGYAAFDPAASASSQARVVVLA